MKTLYVGTTAYEYVAGLPSVVIVCGHYGVGKTNFSLNLAELCARMGRAVTLVDVDVVNPYFRTSDFDELIEKLGVKLIAPELAKTALDVPSLSGRIESAIIEAQRDPHHLLIIDAGGDDVGATVLGRFAPVIVKAPYEMFYVINACRDGSTTPSDTLMLMREIESMARLRVTSVINNTHLKSFTETAEIERGIAYADEFSSISELPVRMHTLPAFLFDQWLSVETTSGSRTPISSTDAEEYLGSPVSQKTDETPLTPSNVTVLNTLCVPSVKFSTLMCDSGFVVQVYVQTPWGS